MYKWPKLEVRLLLQEKLSYRYIVHKPKLIQPIIQEQFWQNNGWNLDEFHKISNW